MTVGMIVSGRIINKVGSKAKYGVIIGILITGVSLYLMALSTGVFQVIMYQCIAFTFISFILSFVFTVPHRLMEQKVVGTAFGIINVGGQAAGIFSPMIMGALIAATGILQSCIRVLNHLLPNRCCYCLFLTNQLTRSKQKQIIPI